MNILALLILSPIILGLLGYKLSKLKNEFYFCGIILGFYYALRVFFITRNQELNYPFFNSLMFIADSFSGFLILFISLFGFLILLYSFRYLKHFKKIKSYLLFVLLITSFANGAVLAGNLLTLLIFWGISLALLFGFFLIGKKETEKGWYKSLFIIGLADFALIFGMAILFITYGNMRINEGFLPLHTPLNITAFVLITIGAFAKAGAVPLHSWIPEISQVMPPPTMAFIPASLDKLLGIYLLVRASYYIFDLNTNIVLKNYLMAIGAITILAPVLMALIQKEAMRLLSFHAVSQVGYMVLGIGTGIPVGVAGGLFHMLNNSIYKTALFLTTGSVEFWTENTKLDKLGGLATNMPLTFSSFLITALAISGIPPLNGFFSKCMVYQGIIGLYKEGNLLFPIYLLCAMLGSILTLASFLKLTHSIFLGERPAGLEKIKEVNFSLWSPSLLLAFLCVLFGIFAIPLPLKGLIYPSLPFFKFEMLGTWQLFLAFILILLGIVLGLVIYLLGKAKVVSKKEIFVGGEKLALEERHFSGDLFYSPMKELPLLSKGYEFAEEGSFDFYNYLKGIFGLISLGFREVFDRFLNFIYLTIANLSLIFGKGLRKIQSGNLSDYLTVILLGSIIFFIIFLLI